MYEEYIYFAETERDHVQLVQEALLSIESDLKDITKKDNQYVNIFRAELIRRAMIHDNDKCAEVVCINRNQASFPFVEYTVGSDYFKDNGGLAAEHGSKKRGELMKKAYEGLNARDNHKKKLNDHHPEYYDGDHKKDMTLLPLIEMVCDWWGATTYFPNEDPKSKFRKDRVKNICIYGFNDYQKFVVERTHDFIYSHDTDKPCKLLIKDIYNGCTYFHNGSKPTCNSGVEAQFYEELNDFLKERMDSLTQAKVKRSEAWRAL